jgi:hypothetical protein
MAKKYFGRLFKENPPDKAEFIKKLFCNREKEIIKGRRLLEEADDFSGILAVHGKSRCGKSHFVRRLLIDTEEDNLPYFIVKINANNSGSRRQVLKNVFSKLKELIFLEDEISEKEKDEFTFRELLVNGDNTEISCSSDAGKEKSTKAEGGLNFIAKLGLAANISSEHSEGIKYTVKSPSDETLVKFLCDEAELLKKLNPKKRILLFIDDLDLLDRYGRESQDVVFELMDMIKILADKKLFAVIVTIRSSYYNCTQKDYRNALDVKLMDPDSVLDVYKKHIEVLNAGEEIFDKESLEWLEQSTVGRIGIFLGRCNMVWDKFCTEPKQGLLTKEHIKDYVQQDIQDKQKESPHSEVMAAIISEVCRGRTELSLQPDQKKELNFSDILYNILVPITRRPGKYRVDPLYVEVIKEMQEKLN